MNAHDFRNLVNLMRDERAAMFEPEGEELPKPERPPRDPFVGLTYTELSTVCGCGVKRFGPCRICSEIADQEQRIARIGP